MFFASMLAAHLNFVFIPINYVETANSKLQLCSFYREWQVAWSKHKKDVLEDKIQYLSWNEFVAIQEGNHVSEMEEMCKEIGE